MLLVGAKGFAKEVLEIVHQLNLQNDLVLFDDVKENVSEKLYDRFPILKSIDDAEHYFKTVENKFTICMGIPTVRKFFYDRFLAIGGDFVSTISPHCNMGSFDVEIGCGSNILSGATFSNSAKLGKGCIVYYNSIITHDCIVGDFVEISPGATLLGRSQVGSYSQIGANATILPDVIVGKNVIVGAGAVVVRDIPDNCVVAGVPATIRKYLTSLDF